MNGMEWNADDKQRGAVAVAFPATLRAKDSFLLFLSVGIALAKRKRRVPWHLPYFYA